MHSTSTGLAIQQLRTQLHKQLQATQRPHPQSNGIPMILIGSSNQSVLARVSNQHLDIEQSISNISDVAAVIVAYQ